MIINIYKTQAINSFSRTPNSICPVCGSHEVWVGIFQDLSNWRCDDCLCAGKFMIQLSEKRLFYDN